MLPCACISSRHLRWFVPHPPFWGFAPQSLGVGTPLSASRDTWELKEGRMRLKSRFHRFHPKVSSNFPNFFTSQRGYYFLLILGLMYQSYFLRSNGASQECSASILVFLAVWPLAKKEVRRRKFCCSSSLQGLPVKLKTAGAVMTTESPWGMMALSLS